MARNHDRSQKDVSITEVAASLGVSTRRIRQLCVAGLLPGPLRKGRYDLTACTVAYCKYQRRKLRSLRGKVQGKKTARPEPVHKIPSKKLRETFDQAIAEIIFDLSELRKPR